MMIKEKSISVTANDSKMLFLNLLDNLKEMSISINIWGDIPENQLEGLSDFLNTKGAINKIRKLLFQELQFDIKPYQHKKFIELCKKIDFSKLNWGVFKEDEVFAFSRTDDDINMTSNRYIRIEQIQHILEELQKNKIVKEYELID